ncbi:folding of proteins upon ATP hydrolysis [Rhizoctonia solani]|uniref:CCT-eta n=1 Tax=Rhizoctonia solani TaxID=456999 RepID=A0A8H7IEZ3_9AGAM|nr:folding of proteins upon ATP hydrolysis [Rhizoctonia solani]
MQRGLPMQPTVILLKEGTDTSQGKGQLLSNISACLAVADTLSSTLGPRGMDKLIVSDRGEAEITNDGATILKLLDIVHPAAKTLVDIARAQDAEVGDGTTSVVLLAAQILKESRSYIEEGVSPHIIIKGLRKAAQLAIDRIKEVQIVIDKSDPAKYDDLLIKCASTSMSSKLIHSQKPFFSRMVVDAVKCLDQNDLDESLIGVKKVPGGAAKDVRDPKIVCLNVELELKAEKDNAEVRVEAVSDYQAIVDAEWQIIYDKLDRIHKTGAQVVLSKLPIGDLATQWFADRGVFCAGRVPADDLRRVTQAVGGTVQSTTSDILPENLGTCGKFEEKQLGRALQHFRRVSQGQNMHAVLRGGAEQFIEEVERSCMMQLWLSAVLSKTVKLSLGRRYRDVSRSLPNKHQLILAAFARALEVIPRQICENAGLDSTDVLNKLRMRHAIGRNSKDHPQLTENLWAPSLNQINAIGSACEAACLILSVDETVKNPQSEQPNPGPRAPPGAAQRALRPRGRERVVDDT